MFEIGLIELLELEFRHDYKCPYLIQPVYSAGLSLGCLQQLPCVAAGIIKNGGTSMGPTHLGAWKNQLLQQLSDRSPKK
jgi:hypothetical protein